MSKKKKPRRLKRRVRAQTDTKKQPTSDKYREGDVVRVKPGTACPGAPDLDLSGWQGRVIDLTEANDASEPAIGFAWDSISLRAMPAWFIEDAERNGLDWGTMYLGLDDVEPAEPRDADWDVEQVREEIAARFGWLGIGPEGERIQAVVNSAEDNTDEWETLLAWEEHLRQNLQFPFEAEVYEFQERGPLQVGDRLTALGIEDVDDLYGIIVSCRKGAERYHFPLADLAVADENSPNAQPTQDYRVWFANR
jgi:hypothetical protein